MVAHTCNSSVEEVETSDLLGLPDQPSLLGMSQVSDRPCLTKKQSKKQAMRLSPSLRTHELNRYVHTAINPTNEQNSPNNPFGTCPLFLVSFPILISSFVSKHLLVSLTQHLLCFLYSFTMQFTSLCNALRLWSDF